MAKSFPGFFPKGCPPDDAQETSLHVYRFCVSDVVTKDDFKSYYEMDPERWEGKVQAYGVSVMSDKDESTWALRALPGIKKRFKNLAQGDTKPGLGVIKRTPSNQFSSHITWWLYCDAEPCVAFSICGR